MNKIRIKQILNKKYKSKQPLKVAGEWWKTNSSNYYLVRMIEDYNNCNEFFHFEDFDNKKKIRN